MIDTLKFARELEAAGVDRRQAEAHARILNEAIHGELVTHSHFDHEMARSRQHLDTELARSRQHFDHEMARSRQHLDIELARIDGRFRLLQWMIGGNTAVILITLAAVLAQ